MELEKEARKNANSYESVDYNLAFNGHDIEEAFYDGFIAGAKWKNNKSNLECLKRLSLITELKLSDIDAPIFTHSNEFKNHFNYIISKIKEILK